MAPAAAAAPEQQARRDPDRYRSRPAETGRRGAERERRQGDGAVVAPGGTRSKVVGWEAGDNKWSGLTVMFEYCES